MNKVAVVTGGLKGIGKAIVLKFVAMGYDVAVLYRTPYQLEATLEELRSYGTKVLAYSCDVSDYEQVTNTFKRIYEDFTSVDVLVNNAGVTKDSLLLKMDETMFSDVVDVNLKGVFNTTKQVYRPMMKQKSGSIINISSVVGVIGNVGQANYAASKAGVIGFTKTVARELASRNISVNAICPGFIETNMTSTLPNEARKSLLERIPMKRFASPGEVASLVAYLSTEQNYITGQAVVIDGGMAI